MLFTKIVSRILNRIYARQAKQKVYIRLPSNEIHSLKWLSKLAKSLNKNTSKRQSACDLLALLTFQNRASYI
jgi:hypothetical protein